MHRMQNPIMGLFDPDKFTHLETVLHRKTEKISTADEYPTPC